ncbi:hypothetical protein [Membranihabitans marinus]|uniref:hypothetical protein n=1 Tax=Membranihabitans marinus TaxID=1227546 RepID=UPI001F454BFA|nr:hypothetical protein [Membranihabitans marinus]
MSWSFQKVILWFSITFTTTFFLTGYLYCQCFEVILFFLLYIFFLFYLTIGMLIRLWMNVGSVQPLSFLLFSFFTKILVIIFFAKLLMNHFSADHRLILLLYVVGYIVASVFDVIGMYFKNEEK